MEAEQSPTSILLITLMACLTGEEEELANLVERRDKDSTAYDM